MLHVVGNGIGTVVSRLKVVPCFTERTIQAMEETTLVSRGYSNRVVHRGGCKCSSGDYMARLAKVHCRLRGWVI